MPRLVLAVAPPKLLEAWEPALRARGYAVLRAAGRADALDELRRNNAAAVVVSEKLPWNGALKISRAVRSDPNLAGVPVVVVGFPAIPTSQRLRMRGAAPDATVPMKATAEDVATAVEAAVQRGPVPPIQLTPAQDRAMKVSRAAMLLMMFGVFFSLPQGKGGGGHQIWWILLVPVGGLLSDWATGRVDGRRQLLTWQGWAAIVIGIGLVAGILTFPGFFGPLPLPGR